MNEEKLSLIFDLYNIINNNIPIYLEIVAIVLSLLCKIINEYYKPYIFDKFNNKHLLTDNSKWSYFRFIILIIIRIIHLLTLSIIFGMFFLLPDKLEFSNFSAFKLCFKVIFMHRSYQYSLINPLRSSLPFLLVTIFYCLEIITSI